MESLNSSYFPELQKPFHLFVLYEDDKMRQWKRILKIYGKFKLYLTLALSLLFSAFDSIALRLLFQSQFPPYQFILTSSPEHYQGIAEFPLPLFLHNYQVTTQPSQCILI